MERHGKIHGRGVVCQPLYYGWDGRYGGNGYARGRQVEEALVSETSQGLQDLAIIVKWLALAHEDYVGQGGGGDVLGGEQELSVKELF